MTIIQHVGSVALKNNNTALALIYKFVTIINKVYLQHPVGKVTGFNILLELIV
jgi:hypothetical protein